MMASPSGSGGGRASESKSQTSTPIPAPAQALQAIFPPPAAVHKHFTLSNLRKFKVLCEYHHARPELDRWARLEPSERLVQQKEVLRMNAESNEAATRALEGEEEQGGRSRAQEQDEEIDLLAQLDPPRLDWIEQDGHYWCWGQFVHIQPAKPTLEGTGVPKLYVEPVDYRAALLTLLRSFLMTQLQLVNTLTHPPADYTVWQNVGNGGLDGGAGVGMQGGQHAMQQQQQQQLQAVERYTALDQWEHLRSICINIQHLINEIRPRQARKDLKQLMRDQIDRRKEQTRLLALRCQEMRKEIQTLGLSFELDRGDELHEWSKHQQEQQQERSHDPSSAETQGDAAGMHPAKAQHGVEDLGGKTLLLSHTMQVD